MVVQTEKNFPTGSVVVGHWLTDLLQLAALEQSLKLLRPFELRKEVRNADILLQFSLQSPARQTAGRARHLQQGYLKTEVRFAQVKKLSRDMAKVADVDEAFAAIPGNREFMDMSSWRDFNAHTPDVLR